MTIQLPKPTLKLLMIFISLVSSSNLAFAAGAPDSSRWSIRYLARASNFLLVANDAALEDQPNSCKIPKENLSKMTMNLKELIDSKISNMTVAGKTRADEQALSCHDECICDIFSLLYENNESAEHRKILAAINEKASKMDAKSRQSCASRFQEFCTSQLLQFLSN